MNYFLILFPLIIVIVLAFSEKAIFVSSTEEWNLSISEENANKFAQFIKNIWQKFQPETKYEDIKKRAQQKFSVTFVKYAAEIAYFHEENNNDGNDCSFEHTVAMAYCTVYFVDDKTLEKELINQFNTHIFCPKNPIPRKIVGQILLLTFSLAMRILLSEPTYSFFFPHSITTKTPRNGNCVHFCQLTNWCPQVTASTNTEYSLMKYLTWKMAYIAGICWPDKNTLKISNLFCNSLTFL